MKKLLILAIALTALASPLITGCGTTPETKIAQGAQIVITGVNDGMGKWADYVNAGNAKQSQIDKVKTGYNAYYTAMQALNAILDKMAAKDPSATASDMTAANDKVKHAESALLSELADVMNAVIKTN